MRRRVGVLISAVVAAGSAGCTATDMDATLPGRVDAVVAPLSAANQFSGAIVLSRNGRVLHQRGFGLANHAAKLTFSPDTPADGGSLAKTFTAAGVWLLVEEGRIGIDDPVTRYVPGYPHAQTTVRHLLSHSNGLPAFYGFFDPYFRKDEVRTTEALLRVVAKQAPVPGFQPGTRFEYSNLGFDAAALVIEKVSGQSYETFLKDRFISRLGMKHSFARPARLADWRGVRTQGYRWRDSLWQSFDVFDMEGFLGASNLYFSATDLARWANAHATGTALPVTVMSAGMRPSMIDGKPSAINGLSWYCDTTGARCYYTGDYNAFHTLVYWDRERNESVSLVSNSTMPPWELITLQRDLMNALAGRPAQADARPPFVAFNGKALAGAVGTYAADGIGNARVDSVAAGLALRIDCGLTFDMFQIAPDVFFVPGLDYVVGFSGGARPRTMHIRSMFLDATLRRIPGQTAPRACSETADN